MTTISAHRRRELHSIPRPNQVKVGPLNELLTEAEVDWDDDWDDAPQTSGAAPSSSKGKASSESRVSFLS